MAAPAVPGVDVDAVLDAVAIARPGPEIAERPVAENVEAFGGDENGIAECASGLHPGQPAGFAIRLLRPDRSRVGDHFVIDHRDRRDVLLRGRPDRHRQLRKLSTLKVSGCPLYKTICQL